VKSFQTETAIQSSPQTVWALLTDAPGYPAWNPTVTSVDGRIALGERITVHAAITPRRAFPVRVTAFEPERSMVWRGGMPLGLFTGTRVFSLDPRGDSVVFRMREDYRGLLAGLITRSIPDLQPAFDQFAAALKQRAESG
jgi:hypothetical protein